MGCFSLLLDFLLLLLLLLAADALLCSAFYAAASLCSAVFLLLLLVLLMLPLCDSNLVMALFADHCFLLLVLDRVWSGATCRYDHCQKSTINPNP